MKLVTHNQSRPSKLFNTIRILVIDADAGIGPAANLSAEQRAIAGGSDKRSLRRELFGESFFSLCQESAALAGQFHIESLTRSEEAYDSVIAAVEAGRPYSIVFVDMRRHLGWGNFKEIDRLWRVDPQLQVVVCTDTYDHPWGRILGRLERCDNFLIVAEPFAPIAIMQITKTLIGKRQLTAEVKLTRTELEYMMQARNHELSFTRDVLQDANRALEDAKQEAERATGAKGEILVTLSHELQAPVDEVIGQAQRLLKSDLTVEQKRLVESISLAGKSLLNAIKKLLDLHREKPTISRVA
ncbi:MAG: hypothetical protein JXA30_17075 [Deltaproteobacteria bacterium]|nr:hypothetical protein [Deltaproteobacteria bacterium]